MNSESKNERNTTDERYATGNKARDEQTGTVLGGYRQWHSGWNRTKDELKKQFTQLTEQDLELTPGKEQETIDRLGRKLNKTPEQARKLVQDIAVKHAQQTGTPQDEFEQKTKA